MADQDYSKVTVEVPDGDRSRPVTFTARTWVIWPCEHDQLRPGDGQLDIIGPGDGARVIASFPFGIWMGVYFTEGVDGDNPRF